ncbi:MAG: hypothetical protein ACFB2Z_09190 [Maricaulaceae bacterium]
MPIVFSVRDTMARYADAFKIEVTAMTPFQGSAEGDAVTADFAADAWLDDRNPPHGFSDRVGA